jgi:hypothetical protein
MTTQYSPLLGLALPVTGELSGTWGDVVNDSITSLVEDSVANFATADVTSGNWTLTTTGSGATNQARMAVLIPTGSPGVSRNIVAPSHSKTYIVINQSDDVVVLKGSATTGVEIQSFVAAVCAWNGTDFEVISDVTGPALSTDTAVATFDGTTGKIIKNNSGVTISSNVVTASGFSGPLNGSVGATTPSTVVATQVDITAQGDLRLQDTTGGQYVGFQAPGTVASNVLWTLPNADGTSSQVLTTNGSGTLSWTTPTGGITTGKSIAMAMIFGF